MKAMILAAGLGKRMHPLTLSTPKPLLKIGDKHLISFHLEKLAQAGIKDVVINTHWLAEQLADALGNGEHWGLRIQYSYEPVLLETAGGIRQALHYLVDNENDVFLLINGDVYFEWDLRAWLQKAMQQLSGASAYLALVPNPEHHPEGDFLLDQESGVLSLPAENEKRSFTYSGVGIYTGSFFSALAQGYQPLGPVLREAINAESVKAGLEQDYWLDVGTVQRLESLKSRLS